MIDNYLERIENTLNDIQKIQLLFRQRYGEECLADKEIEEVLKIAKVEHEEIQQYRAIGTVEECRDAMERKMAKKPLSRTHCKDGNHPLSQDIGRCPSCNSIIAEDMIWCDDCGQKLDWSDTD